MNKKQSIKNAFIPVHDVHRHHEGGVPLPLLSLLPFPWASHRPSPTDRTRREVRRARRPCLGQSVDPPRHAQVCLQQHRRQRGRGPLRHPPRRVGHGSDGGSNGGNHSGCRARNSGGSTSNSRCSTSSNRCSSRCNSGSALTK